MGVGWAAYHLVVGFFLKLGVVPGELVTEACQSNTMAQRRGGTLTTGAMYCTSLPRDTFPAEKGWAFW